MTFRFLFSKFFRKMKFDQDSDDATPRRNLEPAINRQCAVLMILIISQIFLWRVQSKSTFFRASLSPSTNEKRRICSSNPYLASANFTLSAIEDYRKALPALRERAISDPEKNWDHGRFRSFQELATCPTSCIGGSCGEDTSKIMCGLEELKDGCVVYSIGSNNQWQFEQGILQNTPCQVHSFDCTGDRERFKVPEDPRLTFHYECLHGGNVTKDLPHYFSLDQMISRNGHTQIDLFKMDIEGYEWGVFDEFASLKDLPMQILVEVHYRPIPELAYLKKNWKVEVNIVDLAAQLLDLGYIIAKRDDNRLCRHCSELTLLRVFC
jgi:hypothetical protein